MSSRKPEFTAPPDTFYDEAEARQYTSKTRIGKVQWELSERAIELMSAGLPSASPEQGALVLDIGCGSGISGEALSEHGFEWIGLDISPAMLHVARENEVEGDMILCDIGHEMRFRPGTFDGAISISVIQWLCHSFSSEQDPRRRLRTFFEWLYRSLSRGARAILQFYPSHEQQKDMIGKSAIDAGFLGGFVVDNPDSEKNRKIFLVLSVGTPLLPVGELATSETADEPNKVKNASNHKSYKSRKKGRTQRESIKEKDWVLAKKEQQRQRGLQVRPDTKYTGRRRKLGF